MKTIVRKQTFIGLIALITLWLAAVAAQADTLEITWNLTVNGSDSTLYITGNGDMSDYEYGAAPWA